MGAFLGVSRTTEMQEVAGDFKETPWEDLWGGPILPGAIVRMCCFLPKQLQNPERCRIRWIFFLFCRNMFNCTVGVKKKHGSRTNRCRPYIIFIDALKSELWGSSAPRTPNETQGGLSDFDLGARGLNPKRIRT